MSLRRERLDAVEIWTIDRPESGNTLNREVLTGLGEGAAELAAGSDVRAVVITAAGDRIFSGGMDLKEFATGATDGLDLSDYQRLLRGEIGTPVIAAVNGAAVAGGFELVLACDLVVAAEHARFGLPEVKRGLFAPVGSALLPTRVPLALALELGLTGDLIDAPRAHQLGLVNRVVPGDQVLDRALALAQAIAANAPLGVATTKRIMLDAVANGLPHARAEADEAQPGVFSSDDAQEGARAFVEKRDPVWVGH